ncbi:MAG: hypothetical protein VW907_09605, partial [Opitutae bacterium]
MRDPVAFSTEDFRAYNQDNPELILRDDGSLLVTYDSTPDPFGGVFYEMFRLIGQSWNPATGSVGSEFLLTSQTGEVFAGSSSLSVDPLTERDTALFKAPNGAELAFYLATDNFDTGYFYNLYAVDLSEPDKSYLVAETRNTVQVLESVEFFEDSSFKVTWLSDNTRYERTFNTLDSPIGGDVIVATNVWGAETTYTNKESYTVDNSLFNPAQEFTATLTRHYEDHLSLSVLDNGGDYVLE